MAGGSTGVICHSGLSLHTALPQETTLGGGKNVDRIWVQTSGLPSVSQILDVDDVSQSLSCDFLFWKKKKNGASNTDFTDPLKELKIM